MDMPGVKKAGFAGFCAQPDGPAGKSCLGWLQFLPCGWSGPVPGSMASRQCRRERKLSRSDWEITVALAATVSNGTVSARLTSWRWALLLGASAYITRVTEPGGSGRG
jgi:hypothetical protein